MDSFSCLEVNKWEITLRIVDYNLGLAVLSALTQFQTQSSCCGKRQSGGATVDWLVAEMGFCLI